ncbi:pyocin knob domain-containing protein [Kluyvera georgiana]|uniref:pyocin knob domain-containing protein n=1 Tax=Kluyvera georgiana TaxID=73098 RepID=UPI003F66C44C
MSENNYGALMMKSVIGASDDINAIVQPGIYIIPPTNTSSPDATGGVLTVHSGTPVRRTFTSDAVIFLTSTRNGSTWSAWKGPLSRTNPFADIKADGAVAEALANLRLGAGAPAIGIPFFWPSAAMPNTVMDEWSDMVFLKWNGATFSATEYPKLALVIPALKLQETRGEFIRVWDDGRGVDIGRTLLSAQQSSKLHEHVGQNGTMPSVGLLSVANSDSKEWDTGWSVGSIPGFSSSSSGSDLQSFRPRNISFNFLVRAK